MDLQEAIEEVKRYLNDGEDWCVYDVYDVAHHSTCTAIATILNAVVKGELA